MQPYLCGSHLDGDPEALEHLVDAPAHDVEADHLLLLSHTHQLHQACLHKSRSISWSKALISCELYIYTHYENTKTISVLVLEVTDTKKSNSEFYVFVFVVVTITQKAKLCFLCYCCCRCC